MTNDPHDVFVMDTNDPAWLERFNEKIGRALFRKELIWPVRMFRDR